MAPTSDDRPQVTEALELVGAELGDLTLAVYHYGSAVQGGLRPASDLDLFVVTDGPLSDEDRSRLIAGLLSISGRPGSDDGRRPLEVTVAERSALVPWPPDPVRQFQFGEWLRSDFERGFVSPSVVDRDLAPLVASIWSASVALVGPEARDLLVPVPAEMLISAMQAEVASLLAELEDDTTNVLLTLCRMLYTASTGAVAPKDVAAEWVLREHRPTVAGPLRMARDGYLAGANAEAYDLAEVRSVAAELELAIGQTPNPV